MYSRQLQNQQYGLRQQINHQNPYGRSAMGAVGPIYEPGMGARQLTQYIDQQRQRPNDNNIEFWRKFVDEFFAPNAKKRWCLSLYGNNHQTSGVFPQDTWRCEICKIMPSCGFETTVEVLPRLYKIKYDSGTLEELLYVDMPHEYQNTSGEIILDYAKAIQESIFEQLRVARDGQLRIVFSPDLKIYSWEFCARQHEERIPRSMIVAQFDQLGAAAQKYQAAAQNASSCLATQELQSNCNMFVSSARQLAKALEVPSVNDLGYTKRYVRCLQISEVVSSMRDLIDYSQKTGTGPSETLAKFMHGTSSSSQLHVSGQQTEGHHQIISGQNINRACNYVPETSQQQLISGHKANNDHNSVLATSVQLSTSNDMQTLNENQMNNPSSPYGGTPVQIQSIAPSTPLTSSQVNPLSPFSALTPSSSNDPPQVSRSSLPGAHTGGENSSPQVQLQQPCQSNGADPNESLSSVERIIREIMTSPQFSGMGSMLSVVSVQNTTEKTNGSTHLSSNSPGGSTTNNVATNGDGQ